MWGFLIVNLIAVTGYYLFFAVILKQKEAFFPFCFISFSVVLIYLFGCAELLSLGFVAVILAGICLLGGSVVFLYKKKEKPDLRIFINPALVFMLGGIIWCYVLSRGIYPSHYDDFSHWFKICKTMYADSSYPNTAECYFQNYVPGSATWIWYVTGIIGYSPQNCYFAQMVLNLSCCCALLSVADRDSTLLKKTVVTAFCAVFSVLLCAMDVTVYSLLVDGLLGLAASAAVIYAAASEEKNTGTARFLILLIMCAFMSLIKASGSFLTLFTAIVYFGSLKGMKENKDRIKRWVFSLSLVIIPYLFSLLYITRAKRVFGSETWKQGSAEAYGRIISGWDGGRYADITKRFFKECFDLINAWPQIRILWAVMLAVIILSVINKSRKKAPDAQWRFVSIYIPVIILLWLIGVLFTFYTFGEQEANAETLISIERYTGTVAILAVSVLAYYLLKKLVAADEKKNFLAGTGIFAALSVTACLVAGFHLMYVFGFKYYDFKMFTPDAWVYLEEYYPERWDFNDDGYVMLIDVEEKDYDNYSKLIHVLTTYFRTTNCNVYDIKDLEYSGYSIDDVREVFPNIVFFYPQQG